MPLTKKIKIAKKRLQGYIQNIKIKQLEKVLNVSKLGFIFSEYSDFVFFKNESFSSDSDDNFVDNLQQTINNLGKLELI